MVKFSYKYFNIVDILNDFLKNLLLVYIKCLWVIYIYFEI